MQLIQWFIDFFAGLYTNFRRTYLDYIVSANNTQYFAWITATLKVASQQVPYFIDVNAAASGLHPDGYLPENLSPYYFKERPVISYGEVVLIKCTVFLADGYKDVFVRVDTTKMEVASFSFLPEAMATMAQKVLQLHQQLQNTIALLTQFHNDKVNLLRSSMTDAARSTLVQRVNLVAGALVEIRDNPAYIVKICDTCSNNKLPDNSSLQLFKNTVEIIAAVAWSQLEKISGDASLMQTLITQLQQYASLVYEGTAMTAMPAGDVATVTHKNNLWLYLLAGGAALYLITENDGNGKRK